MTELTEGTERVTTAELLDVAQDQGVTARTLEYWRHEGLLPKAERTGQTGKRPEWTYPAEAIDQLATLLRLREKTRQPDTLRVALWFEGFPIDTGRVRASIAAALRDMLELLTKEIDKRRDQDETSEDSTWAALEQVGRLLARKRGQKTMPRYGRQKREDRDR
ncbi:MAG: MerR family transcriptional regulator, partial [Solirubrobacteraceae bacterium]